jgi:hypothetical protein
MFRNHGYRMEQQSRMNSSTSIAIHLRTSTDQQSQSNFDFSLGEVQKLARCLNVHDFTVIWRSNRKGIDNSGKHIWKPVAECRFSG